MRSLVEVGCLKYRAEMKRAEVVNFLTTSDAYSIFVQPDLRLDVARVSNKQKEGELEAFLWIEAVQGFYVLQQTLEGPRPWPWYLMWEIIPESFSSLFFTWVDEQFFQLLADWRKMGCLPLDNKPNGD